MNWGGLAVNPQTGVIYTQSHDNSLVGWVEEKDPDVTYSFEAVGSPQPYDRASISGPGPYASFDGPINGELSEDGRPVGPQVQLVPELIRAPRAARRRRGATGCGRDR